jgi:hypothetical protein
MEMAAAALVRALPEAARQQPEEAVAGTGPAGQRGQTTTPEVLAAPVATRLARQILAPSRLVVVVVVVKKWWVTVAEAAEAVEVSWLSLVPQYK